MTDRTTTPTIYPPEATMSVSNYVSDRIALARVIAIIGMIFVHIPPSEQPLPLPYDQLGHDPRYGLPGIFNLVQGLFVDGFGRTSASLLSVVAGYLAVVALTSSSTRATHPELQQTASRWLGTYRSLLHRRFHSLYVPMLFWSLLTLLVYGAVTVLVRPTYLGQQFAVSDHPWLYLINTVTFITDSPNGATVHLSFLRDVFVCLALSPMLLLAVQRLPLVFLSTLLVAYLTDVETIVILRPLIMLCFCIGLWLGVHHHDVSRADRSLALWGVAFFTISLLLTGVRQQFLPGIGALSPVALEALQDQVLYPLTRLFGTLFIWTLTARFVDHRLGRWLRRLTPLLFVAYCSHVLLLGVLFELFWLPLLGGRDAPWYPIWFFSAPAVALLCSWIILVVSRQHAPRLLVLLTGGRSPERRLDANRGATGAFGESLRVLSGNRAPITRHPTEPV